MLTMSEPGYPFAELLGQYIHMDFPSTSHEHGYQ